MKPYFYKEGIVELAEEIEGNENIYLGIRPYGFHAGNALSLVIYPLLLCQKLTELKKVPRFNIFLFINDWEQDALVGPDVLKYPFNIWPRSTTFQYTADPNNCCKSIVDHWEPIIKMNIEEIRKKYPKVKIKSIRNSSMKNKDSMKEVVLKTIENPKLIYKILKTYSEKDIKIKPLRFCIAICTLCNTADGESEILKNKKVKHICNKCNKVFVKNYADFDYWLYHKPLALPRLEEFKIDICFTGADHYSEGDYFVRRELIKKFGRNIKYPKTLYAPVVLGNDGRIMGKSKGNDKYIKLSKLISIAKDDDKSKILIQ